MNSSEAAEEIVKMSLEGIEVAARITGSGAKNVAVLEAFIKKPQQALIEDLIMGYERM